LGTAASRNLSANTSIQSVPLAADLISIKDKNILVFNNGSQLLKQKPTSLLAAHHTIWGNEGISRAWNGVMFPYAENLKRGDMVENFTDGSKQNITTLLRPNISNHPSSVVFLVSDTLGALPTISKVTSFQAGLHLLGGYTGKKYNPLFGKSMYSDPAAIVEKFSRKLDDNKTTAFIINTSSSRGKEMSSEDVTKLLTTTVDGSAASASTGSGFQTMSPITSLTGFSLSSGDPNKEKAFLEFLKTNFPWSLQPQEQQVKSGETNNEQPKTSK